MKIRLLVILLAVSFGTAALRGDDDATFLDLVLQSAADYKTVGENKRENFSQIRDRVRKGELKKYSHYLDPTVANRIDLAFAALDELTPYAEGRETLNPGQSFAPDPRNCNTYYPLAI